MRIAAFNLFRNPLFSPLSSADLTECESPLVFSGTSPIWGGAIAGCSWLVPVDNDGVSSGDVEGFEVSGCFVCVVASSIDDFSTTSVRMAIRVHRR